MKIAVMQPYLFPYAGYFQLINAVDRFVILDDVNFIKGGWIKTINETYIVDDKKWQSKILKTIEHAYKSAPHFQEVFPLLETVLNYTQKKHFQICAP